jgi:CRP-like cAMP-binding protein
VRSSDNAFLRRLAVITELNASELDTLRALQLSVREFPAGSVIVREGDRPRESFMVLEGLVCAFKITGEGREQIPALYVPGDVPDLHSLHLKVIDTSFRAITACKLGFSAHGDLNRICERSYAVTRALWRITLIDGAIFREWETNIGRRDASARLAHVVCEMYLRLKAVGLTEGHSFSLPLTQQDLGNAMGLSTVHVNRTLQTLRSESLLRYENGRIEILDWERLQERGDFDPGYLHLDPRELGF